MSATYPGNFKVFVRNQNRIDVVEAEDVNELQAEVLAVQQTLGRNVHLSTKYTDATTVGDRLDFLDLDIATLFGYFTSTGGIQQVQVVGLAQALQDIRDGVSTTQSDAAGFATHGDVTSASNTLQAAINAEAASRTSADTTLTTAVNAEATTRAGAINAEVTARSTRDLQLTALIDDHTVQLRRIRGQAERTSVGSIPNNVWTNFGMQSVPNSGASAGFAVQDFSEYSGSGLLTSDGAVNSYGLAGPWSFTATVSFSDSSSTGWRGVRLYTAGGTILASVKRPADPSAEPDILSVSWHGLLRGDLSSYYVFVQVFQSAGAPLGTYAHDPATPCCVSWSREPGKDDTYP